MNRSLRLACLACCVVFAVSCGKEEGNNDSSNTGTNITTTNNGTTNNTDNITPNNNTTPNNDNNPTNNNMPNTGTTCTAVGDACDPTMDAGAGFACIEETCEAACAAVEDCPSGQICGQISDGGPAFCIRSDCAGWTDTSCADGTKCVGYINDAFLCTPDGGGAVGSACTATEQQQFPCDAGLLCIFGECTELCGGDGDCTAAGEACVADSIDTGVGFCDVACTSYSLGECPAGQGCFPVTSEQGVCEDVGTVPHYAACDDMNTCGEGAACIAFQSADAATGAPDIARCLPFCDPTLASQDQSNATCPQPGNPMGYGRFLHIFEGAGMVDVYIDGTRMVDDLAFGALSGGFMALAPGMHTVDITAFDAADNSAPVATVMANVTGSTVVTWGIAPGPDVITIDVPRGQAAPAAGNGKLRAAHAIPDFGGPADVVAVPAGAADFTNETELALNLAYGAAGAFAEVPAGSYDIYVFPAGGARDTTNANGVTVAAFAVADGDFGTAYARGTTDAGDAADPGLTLAAYASAPSSGGALGGWCLDLGDSPAPNSGFCIEDCGSSDAFGTGACSTAGDVCSPLAGGFNGCFPGGPNGPGEACDTGNLADGCDGVSFCVGYGDGSGVCSSYCQPDNQTNALLGCSGTDECVDAGDNLGRCRTPCTPDATFGDTTSCPANLQSCVPFDRGEDAYCGPNGSVAAGAVCEAFAGQCQLGLDCINDWAIDQSSMDPFEDGTCTTMCDPFGDNSECGAGEVCILNFLTLNRAVGHCQPQDEMGTQNMPCQAGSRVCGQSSICLDVGALTCIALCDLDDPTTCAMGNCSQLFQSAEIRIGFCQ